jgi:hypothetical protein
VHLPISLSAIRDATRTDAGVGAQFQLVDQSDRFATIC